MESIASTPRIFLIHNLLAEDEAVGLIERAFERKGEYALQQSGVGFKTSGKRNIQGDRTSASAFDSESPVARRVLKRAFEVARIPFQESMADGLQILRYKEGQAYVGHRDWFPANTGGEAQNFDPQVEGGSNRFATVFLYLWSPPTGGYTVFPLAELDPALQDTAFVSTGLNASLATAEVKRAKEFFVNSSWEIKLTEQCFTRLAVKPVHLGAALFYHQDPMSGQLLPQAEHGACPSLTGTKWGANLWIWNTARHLTAVKTASAEVAAKFRNEEAEDLDLAWSTDNGAQWVHFGTVVKGSYKTAKTYAGHMWRFTRRGTGAEVKSFVVPAETSSVEFSTSVAPPLPGEQEL